MNVYEYVGLLYVIVLFSVVVCVVIVYAYT